MLAVAAAVALPPACWRAALDLDDFMYCRWAQGRRQQDRMLSSSSSSTTTSRAYFQGGVNFVTATFNHSCVLNNARLPAVSGAVDAGQLPLSRR